MADSTTDVAATAAGGPGTVPPRLVKLAAVLMLGALMMQLDTTMTNIATNTLLRDFHTNLATLQWVSTGYLLAMAAVIPMTSWALARFGGRAVWMSTVALFVAGSVLCSVAWSAQSLIAFRIVQGLGGGMILPLVMAILGREAGPLMGRVMAFIAVPAVLGPVLGPVLGGVLVDNLSWRWIFYINVPICLLALTLAWRVVPADRVPGTPRLDVIGLVLLSPAFGALIYGLTEAGRHGGLGHGTVLIPLGIGLALLAAYTGHSLRHAAPLLDIRPLRVRSFGAASAIMLAFGFVMVGSVALLQLYYQQVRHDSPMRTGLLIVPSGLGMALSFALAGKLLDRGVLARTVALVGVLCAGVGTAVFTQLDSHSDNVVLAAGQFVGSFGTGAVLMTLMTVALTGVTPHLIPAAGTGIRIVQQLGFSLGSAVMFIVLQNQAGAHPGHLALAYAHTYWWVLAAVAVAAPAVALLPGRPTNHD
jgi:EmrB/QacA subfamily drug resistance transporter